METIITIHIEKLPEGVYLATSDTLQGLVAQGRTINRRIIMGRLPEAMNSGLIRPGRFLLPFRIIREICQREH